MGEQTIETKEQPIETREPSIETRVHPIVIEGNRSKRKRTDSRREQPSIETSEQPDRMHFCIMSILIRDRRAYPIETKEQPFEIEEVQPVEMKEQPIQTKSRSIEKKARVDPDERAGRLDRRLFLFDRMQGRLDRWQGRFDRLLSLLDRRASRCDRDAAAVDRRPRHVGRNEGRFARRLGRIDPCGATPLTRDQSQSHKTPRTTFQALARPRRAGFPRELASLTRWDKSAGGRALFSGRRGQLSQPVACEAGVTAASAARRRC